MVCCWRLRYAEDRDYPAWSGDLDLSKERFGEGLALCVAAGPWQARPTVTADVPGLKPITLEVALRDAAARLRA